MFYKRILKMKALATSLGVSFFLALSFAVEAQSSPTIRVKILEKEIIQAGATGAFRVEGKGNIRLFPPSSLPLRIESSPSGIKIDQRNWGSSVWIKPEKDSSLCLVDWRRYRGSLLIKKKGKFLEVINELPLEQYLYGVIKWEISPDWPFEAVAAQAIAARTYALKKLEASLPGDQDYHLLNTEDDQVYGGVESEDPRVRTSVDSTRGKVITYGGELINAYYHACSGGYTASSADVWGGPFPYLEAKADPFCKGSPYHDWKWKVEAEKLRKLLRETGLPLGKLYRIQLLSFDQSGRVKQLKIQYRGGEKYLKGTEFRRLVGYDNIKSTLFKVVRHARYFMFTGKGSGHGVGMSQWGARGMAEKGYSTAEILQFYYPGTTVELRY
ncbi:MAG: SpoIID/LytB domain-containing protein [bacterium]